MKDKGKSYQVALVRVRDISILSMELKIWRTQNFYVHWVHRVDLIEDSKMRCLK